MTADVFTPVATKPPHESVLYTERALVGAMLGHASAAETAAQYVTATDFHDSELITVAQACFDLAEAGRPLGLAAVHHHLASTQQLALLVRTGPALLADLYLLACNPSEPSVAYHAEIVAKDAARRRIHHTLTSARQDTNEPGYDPEEELPKLLDALTAAAAPSVGASTVGAPLWVADDYEDFLEDLDTPDNDRRILTPWIDLNEKVTLRGGQLVVIGGRPGDGKSLAGLGIAACAAIQHNTGALLASLEMPRWEVMRRLIAAEAKVELSHLESKALDDRDWTRIRDVSRHVRAAPLAIDSAGEMSIGHLRARLKHLGKTTPIKVVVVDYLQLLKVSKKAERRDLDVAAFTRELKQIAIEQDICIIALSQLNRGPTTRADKKPQMSDLRESGSLEQDADTVILLYRPDVDDPQSPHAGELEMLIPKCRSGQSGRSVHVAFQGHYARLFNMQRD